MKKKNYKLYHIKELTNEQLYEMYIEFAKKNEIKHQEIKVRQGIEMLIHFIAYQQVSNYDRESEELGVAEINYDVADKVIGDVFEDVKQFLIEYEIIECLGGYKKEEKSNSYRIKPKYNIDEWYINYSYPQKYLDRLKKTLKGYQLKQNKLLSRDDKSFIKAYQKNLNKVVVTDKAALCEYVNNIDYTYKQDVLYKRTKKVKHKKGDINTSKRLAYQHSYDVYISPQHEIYKFDDYGRIHHFITNSPRGFRDYLNIWFKADVHNCQPLLFLPMLYEYYSISKKTQQFIGMHYVNSYDICGINTYKTDIVYEYEDDKFFYHYETRNPCNNHDDRELQKIKDEIDSLPADVVEYQYLVQSGTLWDMLARLFNVSRDEIKTLMFAELFYSNTNTITSW